MWSPPVFSQSGCTYSPNYSSSAGWTYVEDGFPVPTHSVLRGNMIIGSGKVSWNKVIDGGYDTRYYTQLANNLDNSNWLSTLTLDDGSNWSVGSFQHYIFGLTSSNGVPRARYFSNSYSPVLTPHDGILLTLVSSGSLNKLQIDIMDNGIPTIDAGHIDLLWEVGDPSQNFSVAVERTSGITGKLSVTSGSFSESICFDIPQTVVGLQFLQHANAPTGGFDRYFTGSIRGTCINDDANSIDCTKGFIDGPDLFCRTKTLSNEPEPPATPYTISLSGDISNLNWNVTAYPSGSMDFDIAGSTLLINGYTGSVD